MWAGILCAGWPNGSLRQISLPQHKASLCWDLCTCVCSESSHILHTYFACNRRQLTHIGAERSVPFSARGLVTDPFCMQSYHTKYPHPVLLRRARVMENTIIVEWSVCIQRLWPLSAPQRGCNLNLQCLYFWKKVGNLKAVSKKILVRFA